MLQPTTLRHISDQQGKLIYLETSPMMHRNLQWFWLHWVAVILCELHGVSSCEYSKGGPREPLLVCSRGQPRLCLFRRSWGQPHLPRGSALPSSELLGLATPPLIPPALGVDVISCSAHGDLRVHIYSFSSFHILAPCVSLLLIDILSVVSECFGFWLGS